jgi:hypothetical protein
MFKFFTIGSALVLLMLFISSFQNPDTKSKYQNDDIIHFVNNLDLVAKVNDEPVLMAPEISVLCVNTGRSIYSSNDPHDNKHINVYVNDIGLDAMTTMKNPKFPIGSVIIKEKFEYDNTALFKDTVELYTMMIKREKGYNEECGDWEFLAIDGNLQDIERGKLANCMKCHIYESKTDFIFRDEYLSKKYKAILN